MRWPAVASLLALSAPAQSEVVGPVARFHTFDLDGDGTPEIESLRLLASSGPVGAPRVVVLVEARLLTERDGVDAAACAGLDQRLRRLCADLAAEGRRADLVAAKVSAGPRHQDGRTLLALRRFLAACRAVGPLDGALLVGHFPDALLLRTCNWCRDDKVELPTQDGGKATFEGVRWLRAVPELVAHRCDLVLADLDGDWDGRYFEADTALPSVMAVFVGEHAEDGGACKALAIGEHRYRDAFHVHDGRAVADAAAFAVAVDAAVRDEECTPRERAATNAIAHPDIAVSRIDARGVAWSPRPEFVGPDGAPQRVEFADGAKVPNPASIWQPDPALEQRLLCEHLDRNHAFRTGTVPADADRPASISWGLGSGMEELRRARAGWQDVAADGLDVARDVDLTALVAWLQRPAVLRTLRAHSDGHGAAFARTDAAALEHAIGGAPWAFGVDGHALVPSLAACGNGFADFFLYRTLWQDHALPAQPYLLVHTGCEALSPPGADRLAYDAPGYGARQHAESILFYTPCLAIVGRAKVFYDEPRGFCAALGEGASFGAAWRRYFDVEGRASSWHEVGDDIGRKRTYFWSLLGDFTLRLPPSAAGG